MAVETQEAKTLAQDVITWLENLALAPAVSIAKRTCRIPCSPRWTVLSRERGVGGKHLVVHSVCMESGWGARKFAVQLGNERYVRWLLPVSCHSPAVLDFATMEPSPASPRNGDRGALEKLLGRITKKSFVDLFLHRHNGHIREVSVLQHGPPVPSEVADSTDFKFSLLCGGPRFSLLVFFFF